MFKIELDVKPDTEIRLKKILQFSSNPEVFASKMIGYQISELKRGITNLLVDLKILEEKYQISSSDFYAQFQNGNTDDRQDYMIWAGLFEMLQESQQQLGELE
jgi:hypothetical protein